jgi:hypothetical protein
MNSKQYGYKHDHNISSSSLIINYFDLKINQMHFVRFSSRHPSELKKITKTCIYLELAILNNYLFVFSSNYLFVFFPLIIQFRIIFQKNN